MILLLAVAAGLVIGLIVSWIRKRTYRVPELRLTWVVLLAVIPQLLTFQIPATSRMVGDDFASVILVLSQVLLLIFVWANRTVSGFWALGLGLFLNLVVIVVNGGWMPISPETVYQLVPEAPTSAIQLGNRLGIGKDLILTVDETRFQFLSDRFLLPSYLPWRVAYSIGDIFISIGAFLLLSGCERIHQTIANIEGFEKTL